MSEPRSLKLSPRQVISLIRMDAEVMQAMMAERIAIHGSLDYTFLRWWYETLALRLKALEESLADE